MICERGFEHHVAANLSTVASAVDEAATDIRVGYVLASGI